MSGAAAIRAAFVRLNFRLVARGVLLLLAAVDWSTDVKVCRGSCGCTRQEVRTQQKPRPCQQHASFCGAATSANWASTMHAVRANL